MSTKQQKVFKAIQTTARQILPSGARAILYGSQARGDARPDSDWDVLVLLNKKRISLDDIDEVSYPLRELGWELGESINTILYTKEDWERNSFTPFYKNVTKDGIAI